jgi:Polyketide cyclase / dehydrase and lipid transport
MIEVSASATSAAAAAAVYALLVDVGSWPTWSGMEAAELETPGEEEPHGVGSVRALSRGRFRGRDTVVELVPDRRFGYTHEGLPVRDYRAVVDLEPVPEGTRITWTSTFRPKYPGTGWIWRLGIRRMLGQMAAGLAEHAASGERPARG